MGDKNIFVRSFSREEQKKLACGTFIGCFVIVINLCTVLKPYLNFLPIYIHVENVNPVIFNLSNSRSDVYEIKGDVRIHGISSTIFIASSQNQNLSTWSIKPYAQRMNTMKMKKFVTDFKIKMEVADKIPHCHRNLSNIPAIVFSGRGHAENQFHAFADVLFPLFLTSYPFNRTIIFLVTNQYSPWTSKFKVILKQLSKYDVYDIDKENKVLCFSRTIVGLKSPAGFFIHPAESTNFPIGNFRKLLRSAYSLERESVHDRHKTGKISQPRMLIISRERSRRLMNEDEVGNMARSLGFDAVVKEMYRNVTLTAQFVNSFDVMVGVHGAGLTNMVFLPENAVLVQITPFALDMDAMVCYGWAAESMNLRYLEYKISLNESSLLGKYALDSEICRDPETVKKKRYGFFRNVYLDNQDVNLDLDRFRKTLLRALELVGT